MRFTVPKFIEYEPKIIGPFTFNQFIYVGIAGAICFVLYFTAPIYIFMLSCLILGTGAFAFAFLKINGRPLSLVLGNFLKFNLSPKNYLWEKKAEKKKVFKKVKIVQEKESIGPSLKIGHKSQLKNLRNQVEVRK